MDDTTTPVAPSPSGSVFCLDDGLASLWEKAYQGEILGELLFGGLAERTDDTDHRHKLEVLSQLELRTREALVPAMERAGLSTAADADTVANAHALTDAAAALSWGELWESGEAVTTQFIALYQRIGELDPAEGETAQLLVAHEEALRDFGRKELTGAGDVSLHAVRALPHMH